MSFKLGWGKENTKGRHLVGLSFLAFSTIMLLVFMNTMQPFLLRDVYDVDVDVLGRTSGTLALADEIASFLFLGAWGVCFDLFGTVFVIAAGSSIVALSLFLFPNAGSVFPGLLLVRILFAIGSSSLATMLSIVLSEVVKESKMGYGAGLLSVSSGFGALFALFLLVGYVPPQLCVENTYYLVGTLAIVIAASLVMMLRGIVSHQSQNDTKPKLCKLLTETAKIFVKDIKVQVACFGGFCARAGSIIVTAYVSLWVVRFTEEAQLCGDTNSTEFTQCGEDLVNPEKRSCSEAFTVTSSISGVSQVVVLIFAVVFGIVGTRISNIYKGLCAAALIGAVSYGIAPLFDDPTSSSVIGAAALWGFADVAMIVFAQIAIALELAKHSQVKGSIAGLYSMFGSLGIIFISYGGGFLFDVWIPQGPFVFLAILSFILALFAFRAARQDEDQDQIHHQSEKHSASHISLTP